jgi:CRP/FNR family cyclic AMP-dependent transcriptional regulator
MAPKILIFQKSDDWETYKAGETIFKEGDDGEMLYVVIEGEVDIVINNKVVETVAVGGMFGEGALIINEPRSATAIAKTDCRLVPVSQKRFLFLVQETPFFALQVMQTLAERLRRMNQYVD